MAHGGRSDQAPDESGIGPLLTWALGRLRDRPGVDPALALGARARVRGDALPVLVRLPRRVPVRGESWRAYRERVLAFLRHAGAPVTATGAEIEPLILGNAVRSRLAPDQIDWVHRDANLVARIELDPFVPLSALDDVGPDVGVDALRAAEPALDGSGVRVAVLDSGVDRRHPHLRVADAVSVTTESVEIPGEHGTHVAGCIASRDAIFAGVAPGVDLVDVKVLHANGSGNVGDVARGIDAALDRGADILSLSLGANHLPTWSENGHGWFCPEGDCELCTAVDNAVALDAALVVVAAGNDRTRADTLRAQGFAGAFDTELSCPGQARGAITVGAVTKRTRLPAGFSSRGPTADGRPKPDLAAPGVNVTSTVAVPRDPAGRPAPDPSRAVLFERMSGTSMATPVVTALAALKLQQRRMRGADTSPAAVRADLLGDCVVLPAEPAEVGAGFAHA